MRAFFPAGAGVKGRPAAGAVIRLNGQEVATTNEKGTATLETPPGSKELEVRAYPSSAGKAHVQVKAGESRDIEILLEEGKELVEDSSLQLGEARAGVLDVNAKTFTLRFVQDGQQVPLAELETIDLLHPLGRTPLELSPHFSLTPDGSLAAKDMALLSAAFDSLKRNDIRVFGTDARGRSHGGVVKFRFGRYRVQGRLVAPPSAPELSVAGVEVSFKLLNSDIVYEVVTDALGAFVIENLVPAGNLEFHSELVAGGRHYYGEGAVPVERDISLALTLRHTDDVVNGVEGFTVTPLSPLPRKGELHRIAPRTEPMHALFEPASLGQTSRTLFVSAGKQGTPISKAESFIAAKGTKTVGLKYRVRTEEYPQYVAEHSVYDDIWSLEVRAGASGRKLFSLRRQVNSQLLEEPVWQWDGSTGELAVTLDVAAFTATEDVTLTFIATATNIGDSIRPTHVRASLSADIVVAIDAVTPDWVSGTTGDSRFYSVPRPGAVNELQRHFTLTLTKPEATTVKRMIVIRLVPDAETILDEGLGEDVELLDPRTLRVRVTHHEARTSTRASTPPPAHPSRYRFVLTVEHEGQELTSMPKEFSEARALWRMPDGLSRYSVRDPGGDDWCSLGTYRWLDANRANITRINDISGEHARDIGHATHQFGTDIDMFHFYTFPGALTGQRNHELLREDVLRAAQPAHPEAVAARARVIAWAQATRVGLDTLGVSNEVSELLYTRGAAGHGLPAGWSRDLLRTGMTTVNGVPLNLGIGGWNNNKYRARTDHDDHVHITLNRHMMGE